MELKAGQDWRKAKRRERRSKVGKFIRKGLKKTPRSKGMYRWKQIPRPREGWGETSMDLQDIRMGQGKRQVVWPDFQAVGTKFADWKKHYRTWNPAMKGRDASLGRADVFDKVQHEMRISMIQKSAGRAPTMVFEVQCGEVFGGGLYDTGAMVTLMSRSFYEKVGSPVLWAYTKRMVGVNGAPIQSFGVCKLKVSVGMLEEEYDARP